MVYEAAILTLLRICCRQLFRATYNERTAQELSLKTMSRDLPNGITIEGLLQLRRTTLLTLFNVWFNSFEIQWKNDFLTDNQFDSDFFSDAHSEGRPMTMVNLYNVDFAR